jgi:putative autoinducer-2 (AI-2) aldolase
MANPDKLKDTKDCFFDIPGCNEAFFLKGAGALDRGMQNRLENVLCD